MDFDGMKVLNGVQIRISEIMIGEYIKGGLIPLKVSWRGDDRYCVDDGYGFVWNKMNEWEYEPSPSNRENDFIERTRYPLAEALTLAVKLYKERSVP
jgi:hypothetical protein